MTEYSLPGILLWDPHTSAPLPKKVLSGVDRTFLAVITVFVMDGVPVFPSNPYVEIQSLMCWRWGL